MSTAVLYYYLSPPSVPVLDLYSPHLLLPQQTVYNCPILQQDCKDSNEVVLSRIRDFVMKKLSTGGLTNLCQKGLENYKWIASALRAQHILINEAEGRRP